MIEVKKPLPNQDRYDLYVNGYQVGAYYGGEKKKYLNPEKWANEQIQKRRLVLHRNLVRLQKEMDDFRKELSALEHHWNCETRGVTSGCPHDQFL